ncbi:hypothetical protein ACIO08_05035 [Avibacterium paragallinarum]|uniref:hypothetical protein n=1 Tax=Avibacterium paragallinarum TaxID=728 RepID=UPI00397B3618
MKTDKKINWDSFSETEQQVIGISSGNFINGTNIEELAEQYSGEEIARRLLGLSFSFITAYKNGSANNCPIRNTNARGRE